MPVAETPDLLYFTLEERKRRGIALIAKLCQRNKCSTALAYVNERGLQLSAKHARDRIDTERLTPNDLRALADFIENLQSNDVTMESDRAA